jgi:hypothetical protein
MKTAPGSQSMPMLPANTTDTNVRIALIWQAFFANAIYLEMRRLLPRASHDELFE